MNPASYPKGPEGSELLVTVMDADLVGSDENNGEASIGQLSIRKYSYF